MLNIGGYFEKIRAVYFKEVLRRELVARVIKESIKIDIDPEKITIKNGVVRIPSSGALKNELFLKKTALIKRINEQADFIVTDIC